MKKRPIILSDALILLAAAVWGAAFVAQRASVGHIGTFYFNGIRFALGALSLIPLWFAKKNSSRYASPEKTLFPSIMIGMVLFAGVSLQQFSLNYTSAGNAGFITGLYVVIIPLVGLLQRKKIHANVYFAVVLAIAGLFLLSVQKGWSVNTGDIIVLVSTFFWSAHVILVGRLSGTHDPLLISMIQFVFCALLSILTALCIETLSLSMIRSSLIPILYGGLISVGIGYTLQVVGQKYAPPHHAAILMSMESVFAVLSAYIFLEEQISVKMFAGCVLMFSGMVIAQFSRDSSGIGSDKKILP